MFVLGFLLGLIFTLAFSGTMGKEPKLSFARNVILVDNADSCDNKCIHIHHWMLAAFVLLYTLIITGMNSKATALVAGFAVSSAISEFLMFADSTELHVKCYPDCQVQRKSRQV